MLILAESKPPVRLLENVSLYPLQTFYETINEFIGSIPMNLNIRGNLSAPSIKNKRGRSPNQGLVVGLCINR
jgi:hypothetical protein